MTDLAIADIRLSILYCYQLLPLKIGISGYYYLALLSSISSIEFANKYFRMHKIEGT